MTAEILQKLVRALVHLDHGFVLGTARHFQQVQHLRLRIQVAQEALMVRVGLAAVARAQPGDVLEHAIGDEGCGWSPGCTG